MQKRHFFLLIKNQINGIRSTKLSFFLQRKHTDLPKIVDFRLFLFIVSSLVSSTEPKEPKHKPKTQIKIYVSIIFESFKVFESLIITKRFSIHFGT